MRARRPRVLRERAAAARRASSLVAATDKPARSASALWIPVVSLVLGSLLTLGTTVVAGRLSAEDDRQREEDAFFRDERVTAYAGFSAALLAHEQALGELNRSMLDHEGNTLAYGPGIDEVTAAMSDLESQRATVSIVGSTRMVDAANDAYGQASEAGYLLTNAIYDNDERPFGEMLDVQLDFLDIIRCRATFPRVEFQQTAQLDIGAIETALEGPPECTDNADAYWQ